MALTKTAIRHAKPNAKDYTLPDYDGLALFVDTKGAKCWYFRFPGRIFTIRDRQTGMFITKSNDKGGELLDQERRRRWSADQKLAMVRESQI